MHGVDFIRRHGLPPGFRRGDLQIYPRGRAVYFRAQVRESQRYFGLHAYVGCDRGHDARRLCQNAVFCLRPP